MLDAFLAHGSELWIFSDVPIGEREHRLIEGGLNPADLSNLSLVHRVGHAYVRRHLESLPLETFDSVGGGGGMGGDIWYVKGRCEEA